MALCGALKRFFSWPDYTRKLYKIYGNLNFVVEFKCFWTSANKRRKLQNFFFGATNE